MTWTQRCYMAAIAIAPLLCLSMVETSFADNSTLQLISLQDNSRRLPTENIVLFSAKNPTLMLQLRMLDKRGLNATSNTRVTLIDDLGRTREFHADESGIVTIDHIHEGLYGIVAFNRHGHAATVLALRESVMDTPGENALLENPAMTDPAQGVAAAVASLTMATTIREKMVPIVVSSLNPDTKAPASAIDSDVVGNVIGLPPFDYRVQLGEGGVLRGQLITVMRPSSRFSAVKGTRVIVTKNGVPIGSATANALGQFQIGGLRAGVHGLLIAGRGGYASFAFEAVKGETLAAGQHMQLVSLKSQFDGTILPVALVPPNMVPAVLTSVQDYYPSWNQLPNTFSPPAARPSTIKISDDQVVMAEIHDGYSGSSAIDQGLYNPLRTGGVPQSLSSGSLGNSPGMSSLSALAGAAAIALPFALDDDAPGPVSTEAGF